MDDGTFTSGRSAGTDGEGGGQGLGEQDSPANGAAATGHRFHDLGNSRTFHFRGVAGHDEPDGGAADCGGQEASPPGNSFEDGQGIDVGTEEQVVGEADQESEQDGAVGADDADGDSGDHHGQIVTTSETFNQAGGVGMQASLSPGGLSLGRVTRSKMRRCCSHTPSRAPWIIGPCTSLANGLAAPSAWSGPLGQPLPETSLGGRPPVAPPVIDPLAAGWGAREHAGDGRWSAS